MSAKVNQSELAVLHGVTDVTIWSWQKEGLPIDKVNTRGLSNEYDVPATIAWRIAREVKKVREESPRDALARAQTKLIEQTLEEKARSLVSAAEVEAGFARMVVSARQRLLQISGLLRGMLDEAQVNALQEHLAEALQELARYDPSRGDAEAGQEPVGAAVEVGGGSLVGGEEAPQRQDPVPGAVSAVDHSVPT